MRQSSPLGPFGNWRPPAAGPVTRAWVAALVVCTLTGAVLDRQSGAGTHLATFAPDAILAGQLWRLLTYALVKAGSPLGLLLAVAALWLFGSHFERQWGSARYARFCLAATVGAACLALPLGWALAQLGLFVERAGYAGPDPAVDALLVALTLQAPRSPVLLGFVLPMQARTFLGVLLGLEVAGALMTGISSLGLTLGGMAMGWLLATAALSPTVWWQRLRLRQLRRRRGGLFVVPPPRGGYTPRARGRNRLN